MVMGFEEVQRIISFDWVILKCGKLNGAKNSYNIMKMIPRIIEGRETAHEHSNPNNLLLTMVMRIVL